MTSSTKADDRDIERLAKLFEGFSKAHGTHGVPEKEPDGLKWTIKSTARTVRQPVTLKLWKQHVAGERPLGIIPIREDNTCSWGSIDFDVYDVNLLEIVERVQQSGFPLVPGISKSGGLHLYLFLLQPEPASDVQNVLRDAAASLGMAGCEIFPKQVKVLLERRDLGNWMVMPYFGDTYGGRLKLQHGLKKTGAEMTLREFVVAGETARTSIVKFAELCDARRSTPGNAATGGQKKSKRKAGGPSPCDFTDGPPCLQHLVAQGVQTDGRKRSLFMMALYYKRADSDGWAKRVEQANVSFFNPPLPAEEVLGVVRSVGKKEYEYTCKEEPMRSHCDSTVCRMRKLGVGRGGHYPVITGMRKLDTEPPVWFVDVEHQTLELTTDELQRYDRFQNVCMMRLNKMFAPIKHDVWTSIVAEAMEKLIVEQAPYEIGVTGRFHDAVIEFLTNRSRGERFEDLFSGRPWENTEEGRHYFRVGDLKKFLDREKFEPKLSEVQISQRVLRLGGGKHYFNKGEPRVRTWWLPSSVVGGGPPLITPLPLEEEDI